MYSIIARFDVKSRQRKQKFRVFCRKREKNFAKDIDKSDLRCYNNQVNFAGMAQLVEQLIRNQQVAGSSPATSSIAHLTAVEWVFCCPYLVAHLGNSIIY